MLSAAIHVLLPLCRTTAIPMKWRSQAATHRYPPPGSIWRCLLVLSHFALSAVIPAEPHNSKSVQQKRQEGLRFGQQLRACTAKGCPTMAVSVQILLPRHIVFSLTVSAFHRSYRLIQQSLADQGGARQETVLREANRYNIDWLYASSKSFVCLTCR